MSRFSHAIIARIPGSVQLDSHTSSSKVDLQKARKEQEEFCEALREAGVDVMELGPEDNAPASSIFVDDVAVVCNGTALITKPNRPTRRKEIAALFLELGLQVVELNSRIGDQSNAQTKPMLEGSDVLFTGREFFVGIGKRTNLDGAMQLAAAFPEFPVTPIRVGGAHALKRHVCLAAQNVLAVGHAKESQAVLKRIEREATFRYQTLTLPRDDAVNCLAVNRTLIFRAECTEVVEVRDVSRGGGVMGVLTPFFGYPISAHSPPT